jgi:hypothetical protein
MARCSNDGRVPAHRDGASEFVTFRSVVSVEFRRRTAFPIVAAPCKGIHDARPATLRVSPRRSNDGKISANRYRKSESIVVMFFHCDDLDRLGDAIRRTPDAENQTK